MSNRHHYAWQLHAGRLMTNLRNKSADEVYLQAETAVLLPLSSNLVPVLYTYDEWNGMCQPSQPEAQTYSK